MQHFICVTCGTRFPASEQPLEECAICRDERQYVPAGGQAWTTMDEIAQTHRNQVEPIEPHLFGIGTEPDLAIAQRALLLQTPAGNIMWDCITLLDDDTRRRVEALGGIDHIAISHPHYYSSMVAWAQAFGAAIHIHAAERPWVMDTDPSVEFWEGERLELPGGLMLHRLGGHFEGGQVLHWPEGAGGRGAILSGDIVQVVADRRWVSFMYSYPNLIPLPATRVQYMAGVLEGLAFDRIYGAWWEKVVLEDGHAIVQRSAMRYVEALEGRFHPLRGGASAPLS